MSPQDSQVIRLSFSSLYKEVKSTATWLQFPFVCEPGAPRKGNTQRRHLRDTEGLGEAARGARGRWVAGMGLGAWVWGHAKECCGLSRESLGTDFG